MGLIIRINYLNLMKKYQGVCVGEYTRKQEVHANSLEEAIEKLKGNEGDDIEDSATGDIEVSDVIELE